MKYFWGITAICCAAILLIWWIRSRMAPRDLESALAQMLANMFEAQGVRAAADGPTVEAAGHSVRLEPVLDNILQNAHGFTITVAVEVVLDGVRRPSLTVGAMGVAAGDEGSALTQAFEEWGALCGLSLVSALGAGSAGLSPSDGVPAPRAAGEFIVYPGLVGTRGEPPDLSAALGGAPGEVLMGALAEPLADRFAADRDEFHGVLVNIAVDAAERDEHCLVDGEPLGSVGEQVLALPWPEGSYMFKQFFLFAPRPGSASAAPSADSGDRAS